MELGGKVGIRVRARIRFKVEIKVRIRTGIRFMVELGSRVPLARVELGLGLNKVKWVIQGLGS